MKVIDSYEFRLPCWSMSYFINADSSGLDDDDLFNCEEFEQRLCRLLEDLGADTYTVGMPLDGDEGYFCRDNDIHSLADNVYDITVTFFK